MDSFRMITWNVNGYTHEKHQKVLELLKTYDLVFLTETKKSLSVLNEYEFPDEFITFWNPHEPSRYHGVAMIVKRSINPINMNPKLNIPLRKDSSTCQDASQGRLLAITILNGIMVIGTYTPNSGCRGLNNLDYRVNQWDPALASLCNVALKTHHLIVLGDLNVAPDEIDVSSPKAMKDWAGFSLQERESFRKLYLSILKDCWRYKYPKESGFTWIGRNYKPNYGMRIDSILASSGLIDYIKEVKIHPDILLSDHIPLSITFNT